MLSSELGGWENCGAVDQNEGGGWQETGKRISQCAPRFYNMCREVRNSNDLGHNWRSAYGVLGFLRGIEGKMWSIYSNTTIGF